MYERDPARRNNGEMDFLENRGDRGAGARSDSASDYDGSAPRYDRRATDYEREVPPDDSGHLWSYGAATDAYPDEEEGASPGYPGPAQSPRQAHRFLDDPSSDLDEPLPAKSSGLRVLGFVLLTAMIGASAGGLCFYLDLDRYVPGFSSAKVDPTTAMLMRLVDEQTKLTQSVTAMQATQDALQKNIASRDQEIQRLLAETEALRTDMKALRSDLADTVLRPHGGQAAKSAPAAAKKAKTERKPAPTPAQPPNGSEPVALSPSQ